MVVPWILSTLFKFLAPNLPEIIAAVKNLKQAQQQGQQTRVVLDDQATRVLELETRMTAQLQIIEQLTAQCVTLEKAFVWALWTSLFAALLSVIALWAVFVKP